MNESPELKPCQQWQVNPDVVCQVCGGATYEGFAIQKAIVSISDGTQCEGAWIEEAPLIGVRKCIACGHSFVPDRRAPITEQPVAPGNWTCTCDVAPPTMCPVHMGISDAKPVAQEGNDPEFMEHRELVDLVAALRQQLADVKKDRDEALEKIARINAMENFKEVTSDYQNPDNLTPEQYGASEGWRLLLKSEVKMLPYSDISTCELWHHYHWISRDINGIAIQGIHSFNTYRTKLSPAELTTLHGQR